MMMDEVCIWYDIEAILPISSNIFASRTDGEEEEDCRKRRGNMEEGSCGETREDQTIDVMLLIDTAIYLLF